MMCVTIYKDIEDLESYIVVYFKLRLFDSNVGLPMLFLIMTCVGNIDANLRGYFKFL